jgi:hypothetical protein
MVSFLVDNLVSRRVEVEEMGGDLDDFLDFFLRCRDSDEDELPLLLLLLLDDSEEEERDRFFRDLLRCLDLRSRRLLLRLLLCLCR